MSELHVLLVHGIPQPGPWHWQPWLAAQLPKHGAVAEPVDPPRGGDRKARLARLRTALGAVPAEAELAVVAHGEGADLWLEHAATIPPGFRRADRVLLAAPAEPVPVAAPVLRAAGGPTRLVAGTGDARLAISAAEALARELRVELDLVADGERLDTAAGYGPWPAALRWCLYGTAPLADRFEEPPLTCGETSLHAV